MTISFNLVIAEAGAGTDIVTESGVPFPLVGGRYDLTAHSSGWNSGSLTLNKLAGDGATYVTVATFTNDGYQSVLLAPGTYAVTPPGGPSYLDIVRQRAA